MNADKIAVNPIFADCNAVNFRIVRQRARPTDFKRFGLSGKREFAVRKLESVVGVSCGLIRVCFFESRIFGATCKEISKGAIEISQSLLKANRTDIIQENSIFLFLKRRQHLCRVVIRKMLFVLLPRLCAGSEHRVESQTNTAEGLSKVFLLLIVWKNSVFERLIDFHNLIPIDLHEYSKSCKNNRADPAIAVERLTSPPKSEADYRWSLRLILDKKALSPFPLVDNSSFTADFDRCG
jgi:hypothetical protein